MSNKISLGVLCFFTNESQKQNKVVFKPLEKSFFSKNFYSFIMVAFVILISGFGLNDIQRWYINKKIIKMK